MLSTFVGSRLEVGHCCIVNDMDRPCSRLVAVVTEVDGRSVFLKYLADERGLDYYSRGAGMQRVLTGQPGLDPTPLDLFGVRVICTGGDAPAYICEPFAASRATYPQGGIRHWQDFPPEPRAARIELVALCEGVARAN